MRIGRAVKHLLEESDDADAAAERLPLLGGGGGDGSVGSDLRQSDPNREFIVAQTVEGESTTVSLGRQRKNVEARRVGCDGSVSRRLRPHRRTRRH